MTDERIPEPSGHTVRCALCDGRKFDAADYWVHAAVEHGIDLRALEDAPVVDLTGEDDE